MNPPDTIQFEQFETMPPEDMLRHAFEQYGDRAAIGTSLQKTGIVIIDIASRLDLPFRVFFIDTLMNPPETYDLLEEVQERYGVTIERFCPEAEDIENLHRTVGQFAHFLARSTCCRIRKTKPLQRALATLDVWISGLRADQSQQRQESTRKAAWVQTKNGRRILKLNPLRDWSSEDVERYGKQHNLPYNKLYDFVSPYGEKYFVIGCEPCHIPVREELGARAGKFPWEQGGKECGLHKGGSGI